MQKHYHPADTHPASYYLDLVNRYRLMGLKTLEQDAQRKADRAIKERRL